MAQTITQILLLIISGIAVFTVVVPTMTTIGETQAETEEYSRAIESAFAANERLNALIRETESLSQQERYRLNRLIPETIDPVSTAHDLEVLIEKNNLILVSILILEELATPDPVVTSQIAGAGGFDESDENIGNIGYRDIEIVFAGTYDQLKSFIADAESSAQLFEIQSISFQSNNSDIIQYSLTLRTFGLTPNLSSFDN
jgi:hypothetical protein